MLIKHDHISLIAVSVTRLKNTNHWLLSNSPFLNEIVVKNFENNNVNCYQIHQFLPQMNILISIFQE